ncbi:class I adenylate-forming enzyme family protein [Hydrogenophaga sp. BPS33]|uniref:class I adenylate-forming enzyme family protein n=1 Tax=Hydrogenophaga sp. BPS33 TaxID=2651974 RepID=UPI0013201A43|nr:AMP-binding protein [Hydrogenophaga sp. BPS33]QHE84454.1 long-chain fatty acid--CoA ligase [Hydrogenophaga sp. BPS33]
MPHTDSGSKVRFCSVPDLIRDMALKRPHAIALICGGQRITYCELDALAARVAASLQRDGLRRGDTVAVCAAPSIAYVAVFLGAVRVGVVVAPLAATATPESLAAMVHNARASLLFADSSTTAWVRNAGLGDICLVLEPGSASLGTWLVHEGKLPAPVEIAPDWAFNIIYSSGTTGSPKGIVQTHERRVAQVSRRDLLGYGTDSVTLLATPLYSNTTLVALFPTLVAGGTAVLMPKFDARGFLVLAEQERATHTMLVPVQYQRILAEPGFDSFDLTRFRMKLCAGAPFSAAHKREVLRRWPGGLIEMYGTTEGGGSCMLDAQRYPDKLHTVGKPSAGSEFQVIDEQGHVLPQGETGEIVGRATTMMERYHGQAASEAIEWFDAQGRRFLRSGDVGYFDADGFLVLVDRRKDMIISGGFNIYPSDLEQQLRRHPQVQDAAVIGVPSERWGETPVAFVIPRRGSHLDTQEALAWCNAKLGKTQRLADLYLVADFPRNPLGKVLKRELREVYNASTSAPPPGGAT